MQHSLHHTYISLRVAIGDDPAAISRDAGHAEMGVTFRIDTHLMALQDGDREQLRALVQDDEWAATGSGAAAITDQAVSDDAAEALNPRFLGDRRWVADEKLSCAALVVHIGLRKLRWSGRFLHPV